MTNSGVRFVRMGWIASKLGLAVVCQSAEERLLAEEHKFEVSQLMGFKGGENGHPHYEKDALIMEERARRYRVGLVRAGETGTSSPFGEDALTHREFAHMLDAIDKALHFTKEEAKRQSERIMFVEIPKRAGTNIRDVDKKMLEWIMLLAQHESVRSKEGTHRIAILSCFVDGEPTVALTDLCKIHGKDEYRYEPLLIKPTDRMVLTNHDGEVATPRGGKIDA